MSVFSFFLGSSLFLKTLMDSEAARMRDLHALVRMVYGGSKDEIEQRIYDYDFF